MSSELKRYVEKSLSKGASKEAIRTTLLQSGWASDVVVKTLDQYVSVDPYGVPVPAPRMQAHQLARDIFVYLLSFITVMMSSWALGALIFNAINNTFPDPSVHGYHNDHHINWAIAQLIVTFPLFAGLTFWIHQDLSRHPEKRESLVRKLMIYFILLIAAMVGLGDLVTVLDFYLNGETSMRFMAKAVTVLGISGILFAYYLQEVRQDDRLVKLQKQAA